METYFKLFDDLTLELQSNCNRSCWFCPRTYDTSGKYFEKNGNRIIKQVPSGKLLDILDQAQAMGYKGRVSNHHLSEPLLDKRVVEIAWEIRKREMFPVMNTNGDLFRRDKTLSREAAKVFEHIVIGIYDSMTKEEIEQEKEFWYKRLGGTRVFFSVIPQFSPNEIGLDRGGAFPRTAVPFDPRMTHKERTYLGGACHRPLERLLIQYDGCVALCCEDHKGQFDLGNAFEIPIKEIWYSEKRLIIVKNLVAGYRNLYPLCSTCSMPPTSGPRDWERKSLHRERY